MRHTLIYLLVYIMFCTAANAQSKADRELIFNEAHNFLYSNIEKTDKAIEYLLKTSSIPSDKYRLLWLKAETYIIKGNYTQASEILFKTDVHSLDPEYKIRYYVSQAKLETEIGLYLLAEETLDKAKPLLAHLTPANNTLSDSYSATQTWLTSKKKGIPDTVSNINTLPNHPESLFTKALLLTEDGKTTECTQLFRSLQQTSTPYKTLAQLYFSILTLNNNETALTQELPKLTALMEETGNRNLQAFAYPYFADAYYNTADFQNYRRYIGLSDNLSEDASQNKKQARATIYRLLNQQIEANDIAARKKNSNYLYGFIIFLVITLPSGVVYLRNINRKEQEYKNLITKIAKTEKQHQAAPKNYAIASKTETSILEKLEKFELSDKYLNKNISLNSLSKQLNTNTKYLSEIINTYKKTNFNGYINELRIKYIINKLNTDKTYLNYKVSYLAEESGFSSHSAFATVFKSVTGFSPTQYIHMLDKSNTL